MKCSRTNNHLHHICRHFTTKFYSFCYSKTPAAVFHPTLALVSADKCDLSVHYGLETTVHPKQPIQKNNQKALSGKWTQPFRKHDNILNRTIASNKKVWDTRDHEVEQESQGSQQKSIDWEQIETTSPLKPEERTASSRTKKRTCKHRDSLLHNGTYGRPRS